mgnify:CR=1 FL=1
MIIVARNVCMNLSNFLFHSYYQIPKKNVIFSLGDREWMMMMMKESILVFSFSLTLYINAYKYMPSIMKIQTKIKIIKKTCTISICQFFRIDIEIWLSHSFILSFFFSSEIPLKKKKYYHYFQMIIFRLFLYILLTTGQFGHNFFFCLLLVAVVVVYTLYMYFLSIFFYLSSSSSSSSSLFIKFLLLEMLFFPVILFFPFQ